MMNILCFCSLAQKTKRQINKRHSAGMPFLSFYFYRPLDAPSVENNLQITPALPEQMKF
jgi:hypothetical protein